MELELELADDDDFDLETELLALDRPKFDMYIILQIQKKIRQN